MTKYFRLPRIVRLGASLLALALGLSACGGGGDGGNSGTGGGADSSASYSLSTRALPSTYTTGAVKAINYGPYRSGGPDVSEVPGVAGLREDLRLLSSYGFGLIRLFGSDAVSTSILELAKNEFPSLKFQLGIYLRGPQSCNADAVNDSQISTAIKLATTYASVVAVSVGNEPSLTSNALLMSCMEGYIKRVKQQVPQPITADDDASLYTAKRTFSSGGVLYSGASFLPWLDFLSIHTYPLLTYNFWPWASFRASAADLMTASANDAKGLYAAVKAYPFVTAAGVSTTVGAALPIVIGETGWKTRQTNPGNPLEAAAATPVNAKWYFDLMNAWQADGSGPKTIFYFSGFDESWKGTDDAWGLWDKNRAPNYALCGSSVPNAPSCTTPLYSGARF
jgi:exo-beta-1,3-glucanase (GH17 family)